MRFEDFVEIVDQKAAEGYSYVTLTGGEPTLHPQFPQIVRHCKKRNMRVSLNSNAREFADNSFCADVLPYIDEMVLSIHAHKAELHDRLTGAKGSFDKFLTAMANIHRSRQKVYLITDTVILTENIDYVGEITDFLLMFPKLKHILFSNVNIPPDKVEGLRHLVPSLPQVREVLPDIVRRTSEKGRILRFYGIPLCVMGDYKSRSNDLSFEPKVVVEQYMFEGQMKRRESPALQPRQAKRKTKKCEGCMYENVCGGVFNSYYSIYKDKHLKAIKNEF